MIDATEAAILINDAVTNYDAPYADRWRWQNGWEGIEFYGIDPVTRAPMWRAVLQQGEAAAIVHIGSGATPDLALIDLARRLIGEIPA